jgi:hypothetical protein
MLELAVVAFMVWSAVAIVVLAFSSNDNQDNKH